MIEKYEYAHSCSIEKTTKGNNEGNDKSGKNKTG
jgi:hypothetical protein